MHIVTTQYMALPRLPTVPVLVQVTHPQLQIYVLVLRLLIPIQQVTLQQPRNLNVVRKM